MTTPCPSNPPATGRVGSVTGCSQRLPPDRALPDQQPAYVSSWIYVFGVLTLAALVFIIVSGRPLPWAGSTGGTPTWWATS